MSSNAHWTRWSTPIFLLVWLLSGIYMGIYLNRGWDPPDEGTLGQSAERVLQGEVPHRDFDDPYTGGLAYVDALIFRLFGINLMWLRLLLFVFFVFWVPALYLLSREFLAPWPAAGVTLVAVAWSVPNYTAAMPSWFSLFFATLGTLALAKYIRRPAVHWLVMAGLCGGFSFLIKSVALYYIAAVLLFLVGREQWLARTSPAAPRRTLPYLAFLTVNLSLFVFALIKLVFAIAGLPEYLHFVLPGAAVALVLIARERVSPCVSSWARFQILVKMAAPFLLAASLPVGLFFAFFAVRGALPALIQGLFATPFRRLFAARSAPVDLILEYPSVLSALFVVEAAKLRGIPRRVLSIFLTTVAVVVLLSSRDNDLSYIAALTSALGTIPVLTVAALFVLLPRLRATASQGLPDQQLLLLLGITAVFSLIQFPYSSPGYFCYVAPLVALLAAALLVRLVEPPRLVLHAAVAFYMLFAVFVFRPHFMGQHYYPEPDDTPLGLARAGNLRVTARSAAEYRELIAFVKDKAEGGPIVAGPDCPEVYFLSGIKNQTRVFFDSLADPGDYGRNMQLSMERQKSLKVVVIRDVTTSANELQVLRSLAVPRFPNAHKIGRFTVYWRP